MTKKKLIFSILVSTILISFGIFLIIFGEYDDSPGGQFLGLLAMIWGIWNLAKSKNRDTKNNENT